MSRDAKQPIWYWLLPLSYAIHIAEEHFGGFVQWSARTSGSGLSVEAFLAATSAGAAVSLLGIFLSGRKRRHGWIPVMMATLFVLNGMMHLFTSIATGSYSPGLVSGLLLWVPLGSLVLARSRTIHSRAFILKSMAGGIAFQAAVSLVVRLS